MARLARVVLPGHPHHVVQRGNRNMATFFSDADYGAYLKELRAACERTATEVWAYCLMPNHVHLVLVPDHEDGLRAALGEAHRRYTRYINFRQGWRGHLWQERFHSFAMDETWLLAAVRYVENNPVKAGLVKTARQWRWSSAQAHLKREDDELVSVAPMLELVDDWKAYLRSKTAAGQDLEIAQHTRTGRPAGSEAFLEAAEKRTGRILRPRKPGRKPAAGQADSGRPSVIS